MIFGLEFKDLSKFFVRLDEVTLENIIPLKTEQEYTGWRFTFSNEVMWLPIGNVNEVLDYAIAFKLFSEAGLYNVFNDYTVYGDDVGLINKVLSIDDSNVVKNMTNNKNIEINLKTIAIKYLLVSTLNGIKNIDKESDLFIVAYTEYPDEVDIYSLYKLTEERTIQLQERLSKCVKAYDSKTV